MIENRHGFLGSRCLAHKNRFQQPRGAAAGPESLSAAGAARTRSG
jgi:hypothetical protein